MCSPEKRRLSCQCAGEILAPLNNSGLYHAVPCEQNLIDPPGQCFLIPLNCNAEPIADNCLCWIILQEYGWEGCILTSDDWPTLTSISLLPYTCSCWSDMERPCKIHTQLSCRDS